MPSQEEISQQHTLLRTHRETLAILLQQQARHTIAFTPPVLMHGIAEARSNIRRTKSRLRSWEIAIEDHPDDDDPTSGASTIPAVGTRWRGRRMVLAAASIGLVAVLIIAQNLVRSNPGVAPANPILIPSAAAAPVLAEPIRATAGLQPTAGTSATASAASSADCFQTYFAGIPAEHIATIEAGGSLGVGTNQPVDGQIGIKLTNVQQPIGAIRLYTFAAGNLFKIESVVDQACHGIDSYSNMRDPSSDKRSVKNYGVMKIEYADQAYTLYLYYHINQVDVTFRQISP